MKKYIVVTHINPDYDGLSCMVGFVQNIHRRREIVLWGNTFSSKDSFIFFIPQKLPENQNWIIIGHDCTSLIDEQFDALILFDTPPESPRIGIHNNILDRYLKRKRVFSIDHHITGNVNNRIEYPLPSTSCCLIKEGLIEDIFYLGIWTDTFLLHKNLAQSLPFLDELVKNGLTDEKVQNYNRLAEPKRPLEMYYDLKDSVEIKEYKKKSDLFLWIKVKNKLRYQNSFDDIVNYFKYYCDVLMVSDQLSGRVSFRSQNNNYDVSYIARKIGGNGHFFASGASPVNITDKMLDNLFESTYNLDFSNK